MFKKLSEMVGAYGMWRMVVNFWTLIFLASIVYDFLHHNTLANNDILLGMATIYCASLAIYSAEKEFRRWNHLHKGIHPGELYAIIWTVLVLFIVISQVLFSVEYHMPAEVSATYIGVIGILAITRESKNFYNKRRRK